MKLWKKLSLKQKTAISLGTVFCIMTISFTGSIFGTKKMASDYDHLIHTEMEMLETLKNVNINMLLARRYEKDFFLTNKKSYLEKHKKVIVNLNGKINSLKGMNADIVTNEDVASLLTSAANYNKGFLSAVNTVRLEGDSKTGFRGDLRKVAHKLEGLIKKHSLGPEATVQLLMLRRHEKDYLLRRTEKYLNKVNKRLVTFKETTMELTEDGAALANFEKNFTTYKAGMKGIYDNDIARKNFIKGFKKDVHRVEEITKKDIKLLSTNIEGFVQGHNEFTRVAIMAMSIFAVVSLAILLFVTIYYFNISSVISKLTASLKTTSGETTEGSHELKETADGLSSSVSQQSAAILETVSTLDEIKEMMKRSVENASFSEDKASESHGVASEGKMAVAEVMKAIGEISDCNGDITIQMEKTSSELEQIVQVIKEISDKTKVINDIVFQTKLLSFNASVEAARAGEHGKGFAVVAEEVGNLATMSGNASKEIEDLLSNSVNRVEAIVTDSKSAVGRLVDTAKGKTEYGVETANKCNEVLDSVVNNVAHVKDLMREISGAASEQATGVENISQAMNELDESTHLNTNLANNTAVNSAQMAKQANDLDDIVNSLEGIINGIKNSAIQKNISNVIDLGKEKQKRSSEDSVKSDEPLGSTPTSGDIPEAQMVVGSSVPDLPSRDDDRFEDV